MDQQRPLRVLSLDGGGVRGLTALRILEGIFLSVENEVGKSVKPCEYFDLIGGTSTGGLIAVMLGRLEMSIEDAITAYKELAPEIFPKKLWSRNPVTKYIGSEAKQYWFEGKNLESAVTKLLERKDLDSQTKFRVDDESLCKVAVNARSMMFEFIRSYKSRSVGHPNYDCCIWEAVRATSAAPLFFEPITLKTSGDTFVDGALRANNPVEHIIAEAARLWRDREIGCLISIGTGVRMVSSIGVDKSPMHKVAQALSEIATDADTKAREFRDRQDVKQLARSNRYFRFSVAQGMDKVDLADFEKVQWMDSFTTPYLQDETDRIEICSRRLVDPKKEESPHQLPWANDFPHDPGFIGREDILDAIDDKFKTEQCVALYGLGGIGKSQITIEYCHRLAKKSPGTMIFWVHCNNITRFSRSYEEIGKKAQIIKEEEPNDKIKDRVLRWLKDSKNGRWLMVFDNADDKQMFFPEPDNEAEPAAHYIPNTEHGLLLFASRDRGTAFALVSNPTRLIHVDPLSEEESIKLLQQKVPGETCSTAARELVNELQLLPLAISQASSFINEMPSEMSVSKYLSLFRESRANQMSLLNRHFADKTESTSVFTSWEISFRQIRKQKPLAAALLSYVCLLDRQKIPRTLVGGLFENEQQLVEALGSLVGFSLIHAMAPEEKYGQPEFYHMHRLVQLATHGWLEVNNESCQWAEKALECLLKSFPNADGFDSWEVYAACLLPHAQTLLKNKSIAGRDLVSRAELLFLIALCIHYQGRYNEAEIACSEALDINTRVLGAKHAKTLKCMGMLGTILQDKGNLSKAKALLETVVKANRRQFGRKDFRTFRDMHQLARTYLDFGQLDKSQELLEKISKIHRKNPRLDYADILGVKYDLACICSCKSQHQMAKVLLMEVMEAQERTMSPNSRRLLRTKTNLANVYIDLHRWDLAENLHLQIHLGTKKLYGLEHPTSLIYMNNLGVCYLQTNRVSQAVKIFSQVLEIRKWLLPPDHPHTCLTLYCLGRAWIDQRRFSEAAELFTELQPKLTQHPHLGPGARVIAIYLRVYEQQLGQKSTGRTL